MDVTPCKQTVRNPDDFYSVSSEGSAFRLEKETGRFNLPADVCTFLPGRWSVRWHGTTAHKEFGLVKPAQRDHGTLTNTIAAFGQKSRSSPEMDARSDPGRDLIAKKTGQVLPCPVLTFKNQRPL